MGSKLCGFQSLRAAVLPSKIQVETAHDKMYHWPRLKPHTHTVQSLNPRRSLPSSLDSLVVGDLSLSLSLPLPLSLSLSLSRSLFLYISRYLSLNCSRSRRLALHLSSASLPRISWSRSNGVGSTIVEEMLQLNFNICPSCCQHVRFT